MEYYCLTIRKCSNSKNMKTVERALAVYESFIKYVKSLSEKISIQYHYEYTTPAHGQYNVHLHAMIKKPSKVKIYLKGKKGYSTKLEKCITKTAWETYITKNPYTKDEIKNLISLLINNTLTHDGPCQEVSKETASFSSASQESPQTSEESEIDTIDWTKRQLPYSDAKNNLQTI